MPRLSPLSYERPLALADEPEEPSPQGGKSLQQSRVKLGTAWIVATVAGIGAMAFSAITQSSSGLTLLVLVALMAAYAGYGFFIRNKDTTIYADSLYYMGFLWSLFGLLAAFVIWPGQKLTSDAVLVSFGYALVSTFSGVFLRQVILQFQDSGPDRVAEAQEAIDRHVAALTQQFNEATMEITAFRDRAAHDLGGTLYDLVQSLAAVREKIADQHIKMAETTSDRFEASLREILGRLSAIHIPQEALTAEVGKVIAGLGRHGEHFEEAAQRLETSLRQAADTVTTFGASLVESPAVTQVGAAINDLASRIKARSHEFVEMTARLEQSRAELDGQLNSLQSLGAAVSTVSRQLSAFEKDLRDVSSASMSAELKHGLDTVQNAIRSSLAASKAIESTMRDVLFFMRERVSEERPSERS